ncbi:hypothetical protein BpHYR1_012711 [Brachionus plicatilis]|uniref:Uncharacterized protein n=1 Tax=Brachionus plicatilis TaxID=10195 RepID=A0A3M7S1N4_BRAPC|nr:hypothetical protein BpHYR1_012711 [Brachionus plicatilis]
MTSTNAKGYRQNFYQKNQLPKLNEHHGPFRLSLKTVEGLKIKEPEQIVLYLFDAKFGLEHYLNVDQMGEKLLHDLTFSFVKSFECNSMPAKLRELSTKIADSNFFKTLLYNSVNERIHFGYNINLIRLALKLLIEILNANENNLNLIGPLKDRLELLWKQK